MATRPGSLGRRELNPGQDLLDHGIFRTVYCVSLITKEMVIEFAASMYHPTKDDGVGPAPELVFAIVNHATGFVVDMSPKRYSVCLTKTQIPK